MPLSLHFFLTSGGLPCLLPLTPAIVLRYVCFLAGVATASTFAAAAPADATMSPVPLTTFAVAAVSTPAFKRRA